MRYYRIGDYYFKAYTYLTKVRCSDCQKYYARSMNLKYCPNCHMRIRTKARSAKSKRLREAMIVRL